MDFLEQNIAMEINTCDYNTRVTMRDSTVRTFKGPRSNHKFHKWFMKQFENKNGYRYLRKNNKTSSFNYDSTSEDAFLDKIAKTGISAFELL